MLMSEAKGIIGIMCTYAEHGRAATETQKLSKKLETISVLDDDTKAKQKVEMEIEISGSSDFIDAMSLYLVALD